MGRYCNCGKAASGRMVICEFCISKDRMKKLEDCIKAFLECPRALDLATVPKKLDVGNETHTNQMVFNISCSYAKIFNAEQLMEELGE